jgi:hypothetical protein
MDLFDSSSDIEHEIWLFPKQVDNDSLFQTVIVFI